jgi:hypothetical protein
MIKMLSGILVSGLILGTVGISFVGPFARREARQQRRFAQGVRSSEMTFFELRHLEREQAAIEAHRRMAWSDGTLSPWEARQLIREHNHAGRDIWWAKHKCLPCLVTFRSSLMGRESPFLI